jgi:DUF971 family protein
MLSVEPVGNYAICIHWSDGHSTRPITHQWPTSRFREIAALQAGRLVPFEVRIKPIEE